MPTRTHHALRSQTPARSGPGPKTSAFQPRPFGETAPSGPGTAPDFETQIERAGRFGHNLSHVSVSQSAGAPIQRKGFLSKIKAALGFKEPEAHQALLDDQDDSVHGSDDENDGNGYVPPPIIQNVQPQVQNVQQQLQNVQQQPQVLLPQVPVETPEQKAKREAREADKNKLGGMFNMIDQHDFLNDSDKPNDLTRKEFDDLAVLYSRIREGDTHLKLANKTRKDLNTVEDNAMSGNDFNTFKGGTMDDLAKILQTPAGRELLTKLASGGKTGASDYHIGGVANTGMTSASTEDADKSSDGTGTGASVYYSPGTEIDLPMGNTTLKTTSDTALFHELTHAYHSSQGTRKGATDVVGDLEPIFSNIEMVDAGVKREELATVGLDTFANDFVTENAYRKGQREIATSKNNQALADKYKHRISYR